MAPQKRFCFTGKLARWQGVQVQTVKRQNVVQQYLNSSTKGEKITHETQAIAVLNSRIIH